MKRDGLAQHAWIILAVVLLCSATSDALTLVPGTWATDPDPEHAMLGAALRFGTSLFALIGAALRGRSA